MTLLERGDELFTVADLYELTDVVAAAWTEGADRDWSVPAGTLEWTCTATADHAVDCVYAPAFFLASRRLDEYPEAGGNLTLGADATAERFVESLRIATRMVAAVVHDTEPDTVAVIFHRPAVLTATPEHFPPRAALELILHGHDVCAGLGVPFEPPAGLCLRLREHTRPWPMWSMGWSLGRTDDPWGDLLTGSGRARQPPTAVTP